MNVEKDQKYLLFCHPALFVLLLVILFSNEVFGHEVFVSRAASWRYWDGTQTPGANWMQGGYNDSAWQTGPAQLGYGDGDERTVVSFGADPLNKPITVYFRTSFVVSNAAGVSNLVLSLVRDDGGVVYLNGTEVFRSNLPEGVLTPGTLALSDVQGQEENIYKQADVEPSLLVEGTNIVAVEIHQHSATNSDLSFAFEMAANVNFLSINDVFVFEPAPGSNGIFGFLQVSQTLPGTNVFVSFSVTPGSASTNDFTRNNGFVVFSPQTAERPIGFTIRSDDLVESNETFFIQLFNPTNAVLGKATGSVTIVDYNEAPQLAIFQTSVVEGGSQTQALFSVTLEPPSTNTVSVVYSTSSSTASGGVDYVNSSGLLVFPPGTTSNAVSITVLGDAAPELNELFYVRLGTPSNATVRAGAQSAACVIMDDDHPMIQVANVEVLEGNAGATTADFYVKLQPPPAITTVVNFGTTDGAAVGGKDYKPAFGSFTFSPGSTSFVVRVEIIPNEVLEPTKQFFVWFTNVTYGGETVTATGSILNDDYPISIEILPARESNGVTNQAGVTVFYTLPLSAETNFYFQTVAGSAVAQVDYLPVQGTLTFGPGVTNRNLTIPILPDRQPEPTEYLEFRLLDFAHSNLVKKVNVLIEDDEPSVVVESQAVLRPNSGQTNLLIPVRLSGPYDLPVVVSYSTSNATARAGTDFLAASGNIEFSPGNTVLMIPVTILPGQQRNTSQHFFVYFQNTLYPSSAPVRCIISLHTLSPSFQSSFGGLVEAPGPSSRLTDLVISEIMYRHQNVFRNVSGSDLEFIEIYNAGHFPADLSSYRISGSASAQFPTNTVLEPGAALVLAQRPASFIAAYGTNRMVLPLTGKLPDDGGTIRLRNGAGAVLLEVDYNNERPWPELANGKGFSLVLAKPSLGEAEPEAWLPSEEVGGNPGQWMTPSVNPLRSVVINEVLANSMAPDLDFIELYNRSGQTIDISGCSLSDNPDTNKFVFIGTSIGPGSYLALDEVSLGFKLKAEGDTIYFRGPGGDVIDLLRYEAQANSVSFGRFPEGGREFFRFFPPTPFAQNNNCFEGDVVINEIMSAPPSGDVRDEYVELVNRTASPINASGWAFTKGITYTLKTNTMIPAQGFLVIAKDVEHLRAKYPHLGPENLQGNYTGSLADEGEEILLARPEQRSESGVTNLVYVTESMVDYRKFTRRWSKGGGSSLELGDPQANGRMSENWLESNESGKSGWTTLQTTGEVSFSFSPGLYEIQVLLLGEGECLVDDLELFRPGGLNLLPNGSFEQGRTTWRFAGNHSGSTIETTNSGSVLHLRSSGAGDPAGNHAVTAFTLAPPPSGTYILRASARWLAGNPKLVIRWKGQFLEASRPLPMANAPGTPGLANSRKLAVTFPLIRNIVTSPILPGPLEPVRVSAQIVAEHFSGAALHLRLDPGTNYTQILMNDDGVAGDLLARDGVYSALLPAQPAGTLAAFYIEAQDNSTNVSRAGGPDSIGGGEYLLRFGEQGSPTSFGEYKIWMPAGTLTDWNSRSKFSDELFPCAVAYGADRLIQQARIGFAGAELDRTNAGPIAQSLSAFRLVLPDGEKILGAGQVYLEPLSREEDGTLLRRHALQWMAERVGLPPIFARFRKLTLNGITPASSNAPIFLERTIPDRGVLKAWLEDASQAELFEISSKVEPTPDEPPLIPGATHAALLGLAPNPSDPGAAFRWNWRKVSEFPFDDDYTELLGLHYAFSVPGNLLEDSIAGVIDLQQWFNVCAFVHVVGAPQTYGYETGRNSWLFKPAHGKWRLAPGPLKDSFGRSGVSPFTYHFISQQPENVRLMSLRNYSPATRRAAALALASGPLQTSVLEPGVALLQANGIESDANERAAMLDWISRRQEYFSGPTQGFATSNQFGVSQWLNNQNLGNVVLFGGYASTDVNEITFRNATTGQVLPGFVGWTSLNTWTAMVFIAASGNIQVSASTVYGVALSSPQNYLVTYSVGPDLKNSLFISEIMPTRNQSRSGFLEVQNASGFPIHLASWEIPELAFAFPSSGIVYPGEMVVLPVNRSAFVSAYGTSARIIGELGVPLSDQGGSITLFSSTKNLEGDRVTYDSAPPWPQVVSGQSLQVRNPRQDNSRVGNWAAFSASPGSTNLSHTDVLSLSPLYLNELQPWNASSFVDNAGEPDPWLEIYNGGTNALTLDLNYSLTDDYSNLAKWRFPNGTIILPGQFLVVWMDGQTSQNAGLNIHANFRLSTNASKIALVQNSALGPVILDYIHYPAVPKGRAFGSFPNGQLFQREFLSSSTPWAMNAPPRILINEWMASNQGVVFDPADNDSEDWFELYNPQVEAVSVGGYRLGDRAGNFFTIPNGTMLASNGYLLVWADSEPAQNTTNRGQLHATFGLRASGDTITLWAPDGRVVDQAFTGNQTGNNSRGRWPDGSQVLRDMFIVTPGTSNRIFNQAAPVIAPISAQALVAGQTLKVPFSVNDFDTPTQFVTTRLSADSPTGAMIQPASGIVWATSVQQPPGTNWITIEAADDDIPPLVGSRTFPVIVYPPLRLKMVPTENEQNAIQFETIPGKNYAVEFKDQLGTPSWSRVNVFSNVGSSVQFLLSPGTNAQRFFRLVLLP